MNKNATLFSPPRPVWRALRTLAGLVLLGPTLACAVLDSASNAGSTTTTRNLRVSATGPTISGGAGAAFPTLYLGSTCENTLPYILAFDAKTGQLFVKAPVSNGIAGFVYGDVAVQDGLVSLGVDDGNLAVVKIDSLQQQYHFNDPDPNAGGINSTAAVAGGWIYVGVGGTPNNFMPEPMMLYGLEMRPAGQLVLRWKFTYAGTPALGAYSTPVVSGDVVYVGGPDGYVYAFNRFTGAVLWRFLTNPLRGIVASLALAGSDTVIAHGVDGYIYAIHSGQLVWKYDSTSPGIPAGYADSTPLLVNGSSMSALAQPSMRLTPQQGSSSGYLSISDGCSRHRRWFRECSTSAPTMVMSTPSTPAQERSNGASILATPCSGSRLWATETSILVGVISIPISLPSPRGQTEANSSGLPTSS
jgi:outer membrane protein assembly factor BamB